MTAISSAGGISQPSTHTWIHPAALVAAIGHLFTASHATTSHAEVHTEAEPVLRTPRPPKRYATYYESGMAGRERYRL